MQSETLILIVSAAIGFLLLGLIGWFTVQFLRSQKLRKKYGSEYDFLLEKEGSQSKAEGELIEREKRIGLLEIRPLQPAEWERYHSDWVEIQADFVDDPARAVQKADRLVTEIMILRGFSMGDFEQRAADLSVLYPELVMDFRSGHEIAEISRNGGTSTEELRHAMVQYRDVVEALMRTEISEGERREEEEKVPA